MGEHIRLSERDFAARLLSVKEAVVLTHTRPDGDTVGTAIALVRILRALGKKTAYASEEPLPPRLAFLWQGEERTTELAGKTLIAVDVAAPAQLGGLCAVTHDGADVAFMLDHHEFGTPFAPYFLMPHASSAAEALYEVVKILVAEGYLTMTAEIAAPLYAAISSDTGGFRYSNTTPATLRAAADLCEYPIDIADINHRLFVTKSLSQIKAEQLTAAHLKTVLGYPIAYSVISREARKQAGLAPGDFESAIEIPRSLGGIEIAFVLREGDEGDYRVSLRSTGADVAATAAAFGGGGHKRAAGCSPKADSLAQALAAVITEIKKNYDN